MNSIYLLGHYFNLLMKEKRLFSVVVTISFAFLCAQCGEKNDQAKELLYLPVEKESAIHNKINLEDSVSNGINGGIIEDAEKFLSNLNKHRLTIVKTETINQPNYEENEEDSTLISIQLWNNPFISFYTYKAFLKAI